MRIRVGLDDVMCQFRGPGGTHADAAPVHGAVARLDSLRAVGHEIVINTAHYMTTWDKVDLAGANLPQSAERRVMSS